MKTKVTIKKLPAKKVSVVNTSKPSKVILKKKTA